MYTFSSAERKKPGVDLILEENDHCFAFACVTSPALPGQAFLTRKTPLPLHLSDIEQFLTKNHRNKALRLLHKSPLFNTEDPALTLLHFYAIRTQQHPAFVNVNRSLLASHLCAFAHQAAIKQAEETSTLPKVSGMFKAQFSYTENVTDREPQEPAVVDFMLWLRENRIIDVALFYASDRFKDKNEDIKAETVKPKRNKGPRKTETKPPQPRQAETQWPEYSRIESAPIDGSLKRCVVNGVRYLFINHNGHGRYKWEKFGSRGRPAGSKDKRPRKARARKTEESNAGA